MSLVVEDPAEVHIPIPLVNQRDIADSDKRFKVGACGRRWGKTRFALRAGILGHGPRICDENGVFRYKYKGISDSKLGAKVYIVWVALDYGQANEIWEEEIKPRFTNKVGVRISEKTRSLYIGNGQLQIISSNNIDVIRGKKPDGVIFDEAAHYDLEYGWRRVVRPALGDKRGWCIFISTTEIGSFFNRLCTEIENKERSDEWGLFEGKISDNPLLSPEEITSMYADYPPGSTDAQQELEAKRLEAHGDLFKAEYFHYYKEADRYAMYIEHLRYPFLEIVITCDLASAMKQTSDYTAAMVGGLTAPSPLGYKKCGVLWVENEHLEGPDQINMLKKLIDHWKPNKVLIEAVQYQLTAVQTLRRERPKTNIVAIYPDKDKRSRAVPWATAMSRADVWWPRQSGWLDVTVKQHLKFPNGKEGSRYPEDHDDIVDDGSMMAIEITPTDKTEGRWGTTRVSQ
jgi:phage terminase large subunit-like protein